MTDNTALESIRRIGRRLIDLTGNGPPTRAETIAQRLGLGRRPRYACAHGSFISDAGPLGRLSARLEREAALPPQKPLYRCLVHTISATTGIPDQGGLAVEQHVLGLSRATYWTDLTGAEPAQAIAKIGRLLVYGQSFMDELDGVRPSRFLCETPDTLAAINALLQGVLAAGGYDQPDERLVLTLPTPLVRGSLTLEGIEAEVPPRLQRLLDKLLPATVRIYAADAHGMHAVEPAYLSITLGGNNPLDNIRLVQRLDETAKGDLEGLLLIPR